MRAGCSRSWIWRSILVLSLCLGAPLLNQFFRETAPLGNIAAQSLANASERLFARAHLDAVLIYPKNHLGAFLQIELAADCGRDQDSARFLYLNRKRLHTAILSYASETR